jgi:hypothetical protein
MLRAFFFLDYFFGKMESKKAADEAEAEAERRKRK